jgi:hypothetical protein
MWSLVVPLAFLAATVRAQAPLSELSADDVAILRLAMRDGPYDLSGWKKDGIRPELLASSGAPCGLSGCTDTLLSPPERPINFLGLDREQYVNLLSAFRRRNAQSWSLERVRTELQAAWPDPDGERAVSTRFIVRLSLPGYSADGRFALVSVYGAAADCQGDCGSWGKLLGFVRRSGEWVTVRGGGWIS